MDNQEQYLDAFTRAKKFLEDKFTASPAANVTDGSKLAPLDVFVWCDEVYILDETNGRTGIVRHMDGSMASNNWFWAFDSEPYIKIGQIKKDGLDEIKSKLKPRY